MYKIKRKNRAKIAAAMKFEAILLKSDGTSVRILPADGKRFSLDEVQRYVGGWVQRLSIDANTVMIVDDDGKSKRLRTNPIATRIYRRGIAARKITNPIMESRRQECLRDFVVGDVIVCHPRMF